MEENINETGPVEELGGETSGGENKKVVSKIIIILVVLVVLGAVYMFARRATESGKIGESAKTEQPSEEAVVPETTPPAAAETATSTPAATEESANSVIITHTDDGFSPSTVTIKQGDTITFKNDGPTPSWPASAKHPDHTVYPGSDIAKCATPEQAAIFDACRGLQTGESWSFKFDNVGTWNYHDHLSPSQFGAIVVE